MKGSLAVVGVFSYLDDTLKAIKQMQDRNLDLRVYSPTANHEIEHLAYPEKSNVRKVTLTGGLLGITAGFSLAILCSMDYPLRVSAKPIISPPGFVVIGYECMILFAALATFLAILHFCRLPDILRKVGYDPRFTDDKFGVVVGCERNQVEEIKKKLEECGALEVQVKDGL